MTNKATFQAYKSISNCAMFFCGSPFVPIVLPDSSGFWDPIVLPVRVASGIQLCFRVLWLSLFSQGEGRAIVASGVPGVRHPLAKSQSENQVKVKFSRQIEKNLKSA